MITSTLTRYLHLWEETITNWLTQTSLLPLSVKLCLVQLCHHSIGSMVIENKAHKSGSKLELLLSMLMYRSGSTHDPLLLRKPNAFLSSFVSKKPQAIMCLCQLVLKAFDTNNRATDAKTIWASAEHNETVEPKRFRCHPGLSTNVLMKTNSLCSSLPLF